MYVSAVEGLPLDKDSQSATRPLNLQTKKMDIDNLMTSLHD